MKGDSRFRNPHSIIARRSLFPRAFRGDTPWLLRNWGELDSGGRPWIETHPLVSGALQEAYAARLVVGEGVTSLVCLATPLAVRRRKKHERSVVVSRRIGLWDGYYASSRISIYCSGEGARGGELYPCDRKGMERCSGASRPLQEASVIKLIERERFAFWLLATSMSALVKRGISNA